MYLDLSNNSISDLRQLGKFVDNFFIYMQSNFVAIIFNCSDLIWKKCYFIILEHLKDLTTLDLSCNRIMNLGEEYVKDVILWYRVVCIDNKIRQVASVQGCRRGNRARGKKRIRVVD